MKFTLNGNTYSISEGNKKLISTPDIRFLIFNILAIVTCPYATEMCKKACYALKAERMYPNVKTARLNNYMATLTDTFTADMLDIINSFMQQPKYKNAKKVFFRIHESGDMYSVEYLNKWLKIVDICKILYPNLYFCMYTKSIDYFTENADYYRYRYPNLAINISVWTDSPVELVNRAYTEKWDIYTAATPEKMQELLKIKENKKCRCADCGKCQMCLKQHNGMQYIKICEIH